MFPAHGVVSQPSAAAWYAGAIAAYQPKGAASLAGSYVNLANPGTYDAAPGTAPTWDAATGWTFNGSTQYLTTGLVPTIAWTLIVRFFGASSSIGGVGVYTAATNNFYVRPNRLSNRGYASGAERAISGAQTAAVMAIAGKDCYLNGASDGAVTAGGSNTGAIGIGCLDVVVPQYFFLGGVAAVAIYATTLSAAKVLSVSTAMAAL